MAATTGKEPGLPTGSQAQVEPPSQSPYETAQLFMCRSVLTSILSSSPLTVLVGARTVLPDPSISLYDWPLCRCFGMTRKQQLGLFFMLLSVGLIGLAFEGLVCSLSYGG